MEQTALPDVPPCSATSILMEMHWVQGVFAFVVPWYLMLVLCLLNCVHRARIKHLAGALPHGNPDLSSLCRAHRDSPKRYELGHPLTLQGSCRSTPGGNAKAFSASLQQRLLICGDGIPPQHPPLPFSIPTPSEHTVPLSPWNSSCAAVLERGSVPKSPLHSEKAPSRWHLHPGRSCWLHHDAVL